MRDLYSHSLLRSMACWRGESSTSAFGGDWLPSAISDPDSGAAAPAAFLPAASAAALSCCGEGFVPFLLFPASLQARNEQNEICELIFHTSPHVCHVASSVPRETDSASTGYRSSVNRIPDPSSSRHVFVADDGMTDQSTLNRTTFSSKSIGNDCSFLLSRARRGSSPSKKYVWWYRIVFTSRICTRSVCTHIQMYIFKLE